MHHSQAHLASRSGCAARRERSCSSFQEGAVPVRPASLRGREVYVLVPLYSPHPQMGAAFTQNQINSVVSEERPCSVVHTSGYVRLLPPPSPSLPYLFAPQMTELQPYSQSILDAAQAAARVLTLAVFLTIGASNNAVFGKELEVGESHSYSHSAAAGVWCLPSRTLHACLPSAPARRLSPSPLLPSSLPPLFPLSLPQPDVLLNYSALGLGALLPDRPALWLATAVRISCEGGVDAQ